MRHQPKYFHRFLLLLFLCTASFRASANDEAAVSPGKARLTITRSSAFLYVALSARLDVNGVRIADLGRGDTYSGIFDAGKLSITTDHWSSPGKFTVVLNAESGAKYKLELSPREDSFLPGALFGVVGLSVDAALENNSGLFKLVIQDVQKSLKAGNIRSPEVSSTTIPVLPNGASPAQPTKPPTVEEKLAELKQLYDKGLLSYEIYIERQREILGASR